jgi:hypothetical protein
MRLNTDDHDLINHIQSFVAMQNKDNITRTNAYASFYERNQEVKWSFLASMVSRNAGWNMCDLEGNWFPRILSRELRERLYLTYERANWLIFSDAYPQLYLYELSKHMKKDLTYLLPYFYISPFMQNMWKRFLKYQDKEELFISLIINEQNLIQRPVIEHPVYRDKVFKTWLFLLQDWFHFSVVLFPTRTGQLYGCSVHAFRKITSRIELGKRLGTILFNPKFHHQFHDFSLAVPHTGSRHDYEQFVFQIKEKDTPTLHAAFPIIDHHRRDVKGWGATNKELRKWMKPCKSTKKIRITDWYTKKQKQLHEGIYIDTLITQFLSK